MSKNWYKLLERIAPLYRHIVSPGLDKSLEITAEYFEPFEIHRYKTSTKAWTWEIPRKYDLKDAILVDPSGKVVTNFHSEPLCVRSGSISVDSKISFSELKKHIIADSDLPELVPWEYKYFDETTWCFCLSHNELTRLENEFSADEMFHAKIDAKFYDDDLRYGTCLLPGQSDEIILISCNLCHPHQVNDSLSGVAVAHLLYEELKKRNNHFSYLFTFGPEFLGIISWLSHHEEWIEKIRYSMYTEMAGSPGPITLQQSFTGYSHIDAVASQVLLEKGGEDVIIKPLLHYGICNDELVLQMPGIRIPSIAWNRGMFGGYHTNADTLENLDVELVESMAKVQLEVLARLDDKAPASNSAERENRTYLTRPSKYAEKLRPAQDYVPIPLFKGPIFLTGYDLYVDFRENHKLLMNINRLMLLMNGLNSCWDMAYSCGMDFADVDDFIKRLEGYQLVKISIG